MKQLIVIILFLFCSVNQSFGKSRESWFNSCVEYYHHYDNMYDVDVLSTLEDAEPSLILIDARLNEPIYIEYTYIFGKSMWEMRFKSVDKTDGLPKIINVWTSCDCVVPKNIRRYKHLSEYFGYWILSKKDLIYDCKLYKKEEYPEYGYKLEYVELSVLFLPKGFSETYP